MSFTSRTITTDDGLTLYARDYTHPSPASTVLCLHGLTRNSRDFEWLAGHLHARHRVIVLEQRGRGASQWDADPSRYALPTYVQDTATALAALEAPEVVLIGTSMGGLIGMVLATLPDTPVRALVLNDVGPELDPVGIARIQGYVGESAPISNWADAIALVKRNNALAFPDFSESDWHRFARALFLEDDNGAPKAAYDPVISQPLNEDTATAVPPDLWPLFAALRDLPLLTVRGALSDILAASTLQRMHDEHPGMMSVSVSNRGHAPELSEPEAVRAIDRFFAQL